MLTPIIYQRHTTNSCNTNCLNSSNVAANWKTINGEPDNPPETPVPEPNEVPSPSPAPPDEVPTPEPPPIPTPSPQPPQSNI